MKSLLNSLRTAAFAIPLSLLTASFAVAQSSSQIISDAHDERAFVPTIAARNANVPPRLVASSNYVADASGLLPYDSSIMSYANISDADANQLVQYKYYQNIWTLDRRYTYTYVGGVNAQTDFQLWNTSKNTYANLGRYNYTYNAAKAKTSLLYEVWSLANAAYINGLQEAYTLDANNNLTDMVQQIWNPATSTWTNNQHDTYTYNSAGKPTEYIVQFWNSSINQWFNRSRVTYVYDAAGTHELIEETFTWDITNAGWQSAQRVTNSLDAVGNILTATSESYDPVQTTWGYVGQTAFTYNAKNAPITGTAKTWDNASQAFVNNTATAYTYNSYDQLKRQNTLAWISGSWAAGIGARQLNNYYEDEATSLSVKQNKQGTQWQVNPIPANDVLRISATNGSSTAGTELLLIDATGKLQKRLSVHGQSAELPVADLPCGFYSLILRDVAGTVRQRSVSIVH